MGLGRSSNRHDSLLPGDVPAEQGSTEPRRLRIVLPSEDDAEEPADALPVDVISDDALIAALVASETSALGVLYDRHARVVFGLLMGIVGERSTAEDLLQEVFLRAWQQAHAFDDTRGTARCWMLGIAQHLALNELRRRKRRPQAYEQADGHGVEGEDVYARCVDPASDPAVDACCAVRNAEIVVMLEQLPPNQRVVLTLYAAGFSQTEIAAKLGEPLGTIKSRMRRGLCRLRQTLPAIGIDAGWPMN